MQNLNDSFAGAEESLVGPGGEEAPVVSVVLPCLNEEGSVGACVDEAYAALQHGGLRGEVIVVDNNSTDHSARVARASGARVVSEPRRGYGQALMAGIENAQAPLIVMADADMSYDLKQIPTLLKPLLENTADIVLGERISSADKGTMPYLHKRVGTPALTLLVRRATGGLNLKDSQSGFRAFRKRDILELSLASSGMEFASEMLIRAARHGLRITEMSTGYRTRTGSSKLNPLADGWRHVREILRLAPNLLLVGPGSVLILCAALLQVVSVTLPSGVAVGSLRWQPNFVAGVLLVIGVQAFLAGRVLGHTSRRMLADDSSGDSFLRRLSKRSFFVGVLLSVAGIALDAFLFFRWIRVRHTFQLALPLGGIAQSLLIVGAMLIGFAAMYSLIAGGRRRY